MKENVNLAMLCDFYELTMGNGYFQSGLKDRITYFDLYFRKNPDNGGYAIAAGLEQVVEYIQNLHFSKEDLDYLRSRNMFDEGFLDYLRDFRFTGDIWAIPEGTVVFPGEPLMTVRAPVMEAQFIETYLVMMLNHESMIATKAARITRAAKGRPVSEFGSRRAQGADAAILGLDIDEGDVMLWQHWVCHATNLNLDVVVVNLRNNGNVLLKACVNRARLKQGHFLSAAHHRNACIVYHTNDIAAMLTYIEFVLTHNIILQNLFCLIFYFFICFLHY